MKMLPQIGILILSIAILAGCTEQSSSEKDQAEESAPNARRAGPTMGPGELVGDLYINEFLRMELPIIQGWETGNHQMVEQMFENWDPGQGIDSLPSLFLLNVGRVMPADVKGIRSHYFLQIEPSSLYPLFEGDPALYLTGVGEQFTKAGQEILNPVRPDTLGNRRVHRMDVAFEYGQYPGLQTYYSWADQGLFVNLVFTYENEEDWSLIERSVLELMHLD